MINWLSDHQMERLLLVDDDVELCEIWGCFSVKVSTSKPRTTAIAVWNALSGEHALMILDLLLPGLRGLEVLRQLRSSSNLPVLILTARGADVDRIVGLELGADDYLSKPFNSRS